MSVQLALYKGKGQLANSFIRWWTNSQYSHCELVADGWCYSSSAMDKGVRRKLIDLNDGKWRVIDVPFADADYIREYFYATDRHYYGWPGLVSSQLFNRNSSHEHAQFCSEWCANALKLPSAPSYSPASLERIVSHIIDIIAEQ